MIRLRAEKWAKEHVEAKFHLILNEAFLNLESTEKVSLISELTIEMENFKKNITPKIGNNSQIRKANDILEMLDEYRQKLDQR